MSTSAGCVIGPRIVTAGGQPVMHDPCGQVGLLIAVLADDVEVQRHAAARQDRAGVHQHVEPFLRDQAADRENAVRLRLVPLPRGHSFDQPREVGVQPVVDAVHRRAGREFREMNAVGIGAGHHHARRAHLAREQARRVERLAVDVLGMRRERKRQAR
jgi:hypothetical protein